jgi:DNA primase
MVNSPESEIYHKSTELYGIYFAKQAIVRQDRCFLVEGYTDVISMHQSGIENVVASSGLALRRTNSHDSPLYRNVTVIYDGDAAGIKRLYVVSIYFSRKGCTLKCCVA